MTSWRFPDHLDELDPGPQGRPAGQPGHAQGATIPIDQGQQLRVLNSYGGQAGMLSTLVLVRQDAPTADQKASADDIDAPIFARVHLGWPGVVEYVDVDWINGVQIALPTPNVTVDAVFPAVDASNGGWRTRVGAYVQPGGRPSPGAVPVARRSIRVGSLNPGTESALLAIPQRAHAVSLLVPDPLGPAGYGAVAIDFCRGPAGTSKGAQELNRAVPGGPSAQLIETGIRSVKVRNLSASNNTSPVLIFHLSL